ncbi:Dynein heavy chain containing protein [Phytophthora infestans]|uniref:Dynein heavy chain containing protein n=1 Tax=Phytophthora infestans TaxID=4787 RepID=A0A833TCP3_PHYIN|nr:Dynein heavy chain containing protein [Phytophthora infestans]
MCSNKTPRIYSTANLNSIFDQLQSKKVRKILTALDRTYCTTFARLCKGVFTARIEANDNMKYLRTLEEWFIRLNNDEDFPALTELFKPMLHIILLIWKNAKLQHSGSSRGAHAGDLQLTH